jgi:hypothetical protein
LTSPRLLYGSCQSAYIIHGYDSSSVDEGASEFHLMIVNEFAIMCPTGHNHRKLSGL